MAVVLEGWEPHGPGRTLSHWPWPTPWGLPPLGGAVRVVRAAEVLLEADAQWATPAWPLTGSPQPTEALPLSPARDPD